MRRTLYESAAAPTSHSVADPAEFNVVCRSKSNLPNRTDVNTALLPYSTHQLGSAHEMSGVWNGPQLMIFTCRVTSHCIAHHLSVDVLQGQFSTMCVNYSRIDLYE